jgi:ABC-type bacteriocin/lantibiotic exporter with double-glycine peptidase domain
MADCYVTNWKLFLLFLCASIISVLWTNLFEEKRRLDQRTFSLLANTQRHQIETFEAMTEIKLTGAEMEKNQILENNAGRSLCRQNGKSKARPADTGSCPFY